ncbi:MAG: PA2779 family protein [Gammaproteobacteria bacterium]|nr:PA2779 family protein [Gammaproteobacteria bacterium]
MYKSIVLRGFVLLLLSVSVFLPAQAGMVGTAQMASGSTLAVELAAIGEQRAWIEQQLIAGGVNEADALQRVAAMTDAQVVELHRRIDAEPAGGNAIVWLLVILLITELAGWTDIIPAIRPVN